VNCQSKLCCACLNKRKTRWYLCEIKEALVCQRQHMIVVDGRGAVHNPMIHQSFFHVRMGVVCGELFQPNVFQLNPNVSLSISNVTTSCSYWTYAFSLWARICRQSVICRKVPWEPNAISIWELLLWFQSLAGLLCSRQEVRCVVCVCVVCVCGVCVWSSFSFRFCFFMVSPLSQVTVSIARIQVDNQLHDALYQVLLAPRPRRPLAGDDDPAGESTGRQRESSRPPSRRSSPSRSRRNSPLRTPNVPAAPRHTYSKTLFLSHQLIFFYFLFSLALSVPSRDVPCRRRTDAFFS